VKNDTNGVRGALEMEICFEETGIVIMPRVSTASGRTVMKIARESPPGPNAKA
jgi:hypothetical protein